MYTAPHSPRPITLLALTGLAFASCTDLDQEIFGEQVIEESTSSDPSQLPLLDDEEVEGVLTSVYNGLRDFTDQASMYSLMEHTSDEMIGPTRGTDWFDAGAWQQLHAHNWTPTNPRILSSFNQLTQRYFGATQVIASTDDASLTAQARFLRAFYMGHTLDFFGQVPFREATQGIGVNPRVLTRAEAYEFVLDDLRAAIEDLPDFTPGSPGTISRQAAQTFLARMLLNGAVFSAADPAGPYDFAESDMNEVIALADEVIDAGFQQLQAPGTYFQQFSPNNSTLGTEAIFALEFEQGDGIGPSAQNRYRMTTHYNQDVDGWNGFATIADFYNRWDQDDERFRGEPLSDEAALNTGFLEGQQFRIDDATGERVPVNDRSGNPLAFTVDVDLGFADEAAGVRVIKYYPDFQDLGDPSNDYVFLRLADVYLMKAEAQLRNGDDAGALETVNTLRASRDGADALASIDLQGILDERGFELYWEGIRRTDLIRFGQFLRPYDEKDYETDPQFLLFPFPQEQITANPNLQQNPGY